MQLDKYGIPIFEDEDNLDMVQYSNQVEDALNVKFSNDARGISVIKNDILDNMGAIEDVYSRLNTKVDKVENKQLTSNDYTNADKSKLTTIEESAQVNKIEHIKVDNIEKEIVDKTVNIVLPKKLSEFQNDSKYQTDAEVKAYTYSKAETDVKLAENVLEVDKIELEKHNKRIQLLEQNQIKGSFEAEVVHIEDSSYNKIENLKISGKSEQATRTGKNELQNTLTTQTLNNVTFTVNDNKSITIKGTATARTEVNISTNLVLKAGVTYKNVTGTTLYFYSGSYMSILDKAVYTPASDVTFSRVYIRVEANETIDKIIYPMIVANGTNETYEQYGVSPSPDFPAKIESTFDKVNLLNIFNSYAKDYSTTISGITYTLNEGGGIKITGTATGTSTFYIFGSWTNNNYIINLVKNKNYTLSGIKKDVRFCIRNAAGSINKILDSQGNITANDLGEGITAFYIEIANMTTIDTIVYPKLELGTIATAYTPYSKGSVDIKVTGKNLFFLNKIFPFTAGGVTFTCENNKIKLNGTATSKIAEIIAIKTDIKLNGSYCYKANGLVNNVNAGFYYYKNSDGSYAGAKLSSDSYFNLIDMFTGAFYVTVENGTVCNNVELSIQLEKGNVATEYEPYKEQTQQIILNAPLCSLPNRCV